MPHKPPSYCRHKPTGRAYVRVGRRPVYLGKYGSPESYAEYERVLAEWRAGLVTVAGPCRVVADLVARFLLYADRKYRRPDGSPKSELENHKKALRVVLRLYGHTPVRDFGPLALKAVRRAMVETGWCRGWVNRSVNRIKTFVGWCESEELVPRGTANSFREVRALGEGECGVRETPGVPPVPERDLALTLPEMPAVPRAAAETLLLTGARPSELLKLRPCDIDRSGRVEVAKGFFVALGANVWAYQPQKHKTAWKGHRRVILFGPRAQAVLAPFLIRRPADAPVFSPAESMRLHREQLRANRKTPVQPSQADRRKRSPTKAPRESYDTTSLQRAVAKAAARADAKDRAADGPGVGHWTVYQLRHNAATRLVEQFGWEVARVILGHKSFAMTSVYAVESLRAAAKAVSETG